MLLQLKNNFLSYLKTFMVINNKTFEGYVDCFTYIKNYIIKLNINNQNTNMKTFTSDFEIGLYMAFQAIFNKDYNLRHIGCYFHFLRYGRDCGHEAVL